MKNMFYLLFYICISCSCRDNYDKDILRLNLILDLHEGISIGQRGDFKTLWLKYGEKVYYDYLIIDSVSQNYVLNDELDSSNLELARKVLRLNLSIKDGRQIKDSLEKRVNFIMNYTKKIDIIASNCFDNLDCDKCRFWYKPDELLALLKDTSCTYQTEFKVPFSKNKWEVRVPLGRGCLNIN